MSVTNAWVGAVSPSGATVRAKVVGASTRLAVSTAADLSSPTFFGPAVPTAEGIATLVATGRPANTQHYWGVEVDGVIDLTKTGRFRTFPVADSAASFTFAWGSCGLSASNHAVFDTIRLHDPLLMLHLGDLFYEDIKLNDNALYRAAYDELLGLPRQGQLYRDVPINYMWDDHDFGPNNGDKYNVSRAAARTVYRERVPSYPLPAGAGDNPIYHTFSVGRCQFVVTDVRSARDPVGMRDTADKSMLGATQKTWFKATLAASSARVIFWILTHEWLGGVKAYEDSWAGYSTERQELADYMAEIDVDHKIVVLSGDNHALAWASGASNPYGGFPVFHAGSLDASTPVFVAGFDLGYQGGIGQYGLCTVTDPGGAGDISIAMSGRQEA